MTDPVGLLATAVAVVCFIILLVSLVIEFWRRRRRDPWSGQSLVEFALVLPLMAGLILIAAEVGSVFNDRAEWIGSANTLATWLAARDGVENAAWRAEVTAEEIRTHCSPAGDPSTYDVRWPDGDRGDPGTRLVVVLVCHHPAAFVPATAAWSGLDITVTASGVTPAAARPAPSWPPMPTP